MSGVVVHEIAAALYTHFDVLLNVYGAVVDEGNSSRYTLVVVGSYVVVVVGKRRPRAHHARKRRLVVGESRHQRLHFGCSHKPVLRSEMAELRIRCVPVAAIVRS
jgi:hypothetical protein